MQAARGAALNTDIDGAAEAPVPTDPSATPARRRRFVVLGVVAAVVLVADVVTKMLAVAYLEDQPPIELLGGLVTLTFLRNPGAAFGLAQGYTAVLALVSIGVVVVIARMTRRLASTGWTVALGLLLGGALGNLTDRIFRSPGPLRGHVVDFVELPNWPVFNVADTAITCAAALIVLLTLRGTAFDGTHRTKGGRDRQDAVDEAGASEGGADEGGADEGRDRERPGPAPSGDETRRAAE